MPAARPALRARRRRAHSEGCWNILRAPAQRARHAPARCALHIFAACLHDRTLHTERNSGRFGAPAELATNIHDLTMRNSLCDRSSSRVTTRATPRSTRVDQFNQGKQSKFTSQTTLYPGPGTKQHEASQPFLGSTMTARTPPRLPPPLSRDTNKRDDHTENSHGYVYHTHTAYTHIC